MDARGRVSGARREPRRPEGGAPRRGRAARRDAGDAAGARGGTRPAPASDRAAVIAASALVLVVLGTAILVDVRAEAAFDAPKRLVAMVGLVVAAASLALGGARDAATGRDGWGLATVGRAAAVPRIVAAALGVAALGALVATVVSPRPAIAGDALRALAVFALAVPLGASRALDAGRGRWVLAAFVVGALLNALGALAQATGATLFATELVTGRADTGAFLGNEGHVAQLAALALVGAGVAAWRGATAATRTAAVTAAVPLLAALVVSRNLTALATAGAGGALVVLLARGRRALAPLGLAALALAATVLAYPPMRARLVEAAASARGGDWDALTTYRLGPWSAAVEMIRERPLVGFGLGTFGAEFAAHRMEAEIAQRRRLVIPLVTSSFAAAHSEYLQAAAECGVVPAFACVVAAAALLWGLVERVRDPEEATEALLVVALLGATALAALTWFPLQLPVVMIPVLLAAGRGWRLLAPGATQDDGAPAVSARGHGGAVVPARTEGATVAPSVSAARETAASSSAPASSTVTGHRAGSGERAVMRILVLGAVLALAVALIPEVRRYTGELRLARVGATLQGIAAAGRLVPDARARLAELAAVASDERSASPADSRGLIAAGTAMLFAGDGPAARGHYRAALARGERAEIDLNLARAYAVEGRREDGEAALLRAGWLSPALLAALPDADRVRVEGKVAELEERLRRGELAAPPPLPVDEPAAAPPGD